MALLTSQHKTAHAQQLEEKKSVLLMMPFKAEFEQKLFKRRQEAYQVKKTEQDIRMADIRAKIETVKEKRHNEQLLREQEENARKLQKELEEKKKTRRRRQKKD